MEFVSVLDKIWGFPMATEILLGSVAVVSYHITTWYKNPEGHNFKFLRSNRIYYNRISLYQQILVHDLVTYGALHSLLGS